MALRRLVVCFDGTWNTPDSGPTPTNVVKLLRAVQSKNGDLSQIAFYDKGVGTGGPLDRIAGGAAGAGLTQNVVDGYRFLGNNYAEGDEIYLFGFSRGAYTARSLAGLIELAGILRPMHLGRDLEQVLAIKRSERESKRQAMAALGLSRFDDVRITCVGVWDTVGSLGIPGDLGRKYYLKPYLFNDVELGKCVDVALHAVAIDEKRAEFSPTIWVSGDGNPPREGQSVEQVWFPGVHSNIGGSYPDTGLSDIALDWMVKRLEHYTALRLDHPYLESISAPRADGIGYESRSPLYLTSRAYPYQRLIDQTPIDGRGLGEWFRRRFKDWDRRNVVPEGLETVNEMLHISALERWRLPGAMNDAPRGQGEKTLYRPPNLQALIRRKRVPVVDWGGAPFGADAPWPSLSA